MTRLGWGILAIILLAGAAFASMLSFGNGRAALERPREQAAVADEPPPTPRGMLPIPVAGVPATHLVDGWDQPRGGGTRVHHAIDIMAPRGTPVRAVAAGRIEKLFLSGAGGNTVYVRSPDGRLVYYYAHLDAYRPGLAEGQAVRAGETIATVGSTGNASPEAPHLHFEVKRMAPGDRWYEGEGINPYPLLVGSAVRR